MSIAQIIIIVIYGIEIKYIIIIIVFLLYSQTQLKFQKALRERDNSAIIIKRLDSLACVCMMHTALN